LFIGRVRSRELKIDVEDLDCIPDNEDDEQGAKDAMANEGAK